MGLSRIAPFDQADAHLQFQQSHSNWGGETLSAQVLTIGLILPVFDFLSLETTLASNNNAMSLR